MKYTTTELKWIEDLVGKSIIEAENEMKKLAGDPARVLVKLKQENMLSLLLKIREDIKRHVKRDAR